MKKGSTWKKKLIKKNIEKKKKAVEIAQEKEKIQK